MAQSANLLLGRVPGCIKAVLSALNFTSPDPSALCALDREGWSRALTFSSAAQLNIPLVLRVGTGLPEEIRDRLRADLRNSIKRWQRLEQEYGELACTFEKHGIDFAVLKGFSHWPLFVPDPRHRIQYDIDLLIRPEQVHEAYRVAATLDYEPIRGDLARQVDHLPTMIRKTGWTWRGDYYDPNIPFSLELHFRCWDRDSEFFGPEQLESIFWKRLRPYVWKELNFVSLHPVDSVLYAGLHLLRHLLHGNLKPFHVYEMGSFLHTQANNSSFWKEWELLQSEELKRYQAIAFSLAHHWFNCAMHDAAAAAVDRLPSDIRRWLNQFDCSPLSRFSKPNKDELWLHTALVHPRYKLSVIRRKLIPVRLPGPVAGVHTAKLERRWTVRVNSQLRYLAFLCTRVVHHGRTLLPMTVSAVRWFWPSLINSLKIGRARPAGIYK